MTKNSSARPVGLGSGGVQHNANDLMARDQEIAGHWNAPTYHGPELGPPVLPTGKPIPTGPDVHPMTGGLGDDSDIPLRHPNDPLPPHIVAPGAPAGPTTLDWNINPHASPQDQVNDIYSAPTIVNPPPAPAATPAPGLAGIRRAPMGGKAMQLNAGMR